MAGQRLGVIVIFSLLAVLIGVPFVVAPKADAPPADARRLIVLTPHVQQIRDEFAQAFDAWHRANHGEPVFVDYRTPGGTSEIRRALEAQYEAAIRAGRYEPTQQPDGSTTIHIDPGVIGFDLLFGGGSYDHEQLKRGIRVATDGGTLNVPISTPADLPQPELDDAFGANRIGTQNLYDPDQYWIGSALSSFGIVYNTEILAELGLPAPTSFANLTDPRLHGWLALADPRQSGSITTTFDSILGNFGWDEGWQILRAMCGNTHSFASASTKPPIDVSQGEAAAGLAIDFYGRGQAQVIKDATGTDRVGYIDPPGMTYIDADPVSILRGGPDFELAQRFVRFCLTEEAQALWQFHANNKPDVDNPLGPRGQPMGPARYELRRMPVLRSMYAEYKPYFVDDIDPFNAATNVENPGWRTGVQMMMGCFGIDTAEDCRDAWAALAEADASTDFTPDQRAALRRAFFAFPTTPVTLVQGHPLYTELSTQAKAAAGDRAATLADLAARLDAGDPDLTPAIAEELRGLIAGPAPEIPFTEGTYTAVRNEWRDPVRGARLRIAYTNFFRDQYRQIIHAVESRSPIPQTANAAMDTAATTEEPAG